MKNPLRTLLASLTLVAATQACASEAPVVEHEAPLIEHLVQACDNEINSFCSKVTPGEGRMLHCMAAHSDKLSGQCDYALYQAASILEQLSSAIAYVATQCQTDIETHCNTVALGEGRMLSCLEQQKDLSEECSKAITDTVGDADTVATVGGSQ